MTSFGEWLQGQLDERQWKAIRLTEKTGLDSGIISRALSNERIPSPKSLQKIADALDLDFDVVYAASIGKQPGTQEKTKLRILTNIASQLDEDDVDDLIDSARSKRRRKEAKNGKAKHANT